MNHRYLNSVLLACGAALLSQATLAAEPHVHATWEFLSKGRRGNSTPLLTYPACKSARSPSTVARASWCKVNVRFTPA